MATPVSPTSAGASSSDDGSLGKLSKQLEVLGDKLDSLGSVLGGKTNRYESHDPLGRGPNSLRQGLDNAKEGLNSLVGGIASLLGKLFGIKPPPKPPEPPKVDTAGSLSKLAEAANQAAAALGKLKDDTGLPKPDFNKAFPTPGSSAWEKAFPRLPKPDFNQLNTPIPDDAGWLKRMARKIGRGLKWAGGKAMAPLRAAGRAAGWAGRKIGAGAAWLGSTKLGRAAKATGRGLGWAGKKVGQGANWVGKKVLGPAGAVAGAAVVGGLSALSNSLRELRTPLGPVGIGFNILGSALSGLASVVKKIPNIGPILGPILEAAAAVPAILKDITETLVSFAAKASPAQFAMWQMALEDVQGVIGQSFLPVLELMRNSVRLFGETLANLLPSEGEVYDALKQLREGFQEFAKSVREVLKDIGPTIRQHLVGVLKDLAFHMTNFMKSIDVKALGDMVLALAELQKALAPISNAFNILVTSALTGFINGLAKLITMLSHGTTSLVNAIRSLFGLRKITLDKLGPGSLRSDIGAAAHPAQISGIEEYQKKLQTSAYSMPGNTMDDVPSMVNDIDNTLTDMKQWLMVDMPNWFVHDAGPQLIQLLIVGLPNGASEGLFGRNDSAASGAFSSGGWTGAAVKGARIITGLVTGSPNLSW